LIYIGYLAVLRNCQRQGLGTYLLIDALRRCFAVSSHVPFYGVGLRSLNEQTTKLYEKYGFGKKDEERNPLMILPVWSLYDLFQPAEKSK
jgi:ribosomal protein S18 acetylase RimI-like enzyme